MKCAIYARVSTANEGQKTSIPTQIKLFDNLIKEKGWELYKVYTDVKSGSKTNRDGIQQLLQDAKDKKFDIIVAKEFSRISRNGAFSCEFKNTLLLNQIHLITLDGAINTLEDNAMNFGLFAWLSENEAMRTSKRIKSSYEVRAKSGRFDEAPYGYDLRDGKLYISKDGSAEIVKRIFKEYISGKSFDGIARQLFNENVPTPATRKNHANSSIYWHGSTVRQILERENYTGRLVANKTNTISPTTTKRITNAPEDWIICEDTHEAIISSEDFILVQQLIKQRKRIRSQQQYHLFTGMLECANCGAMMQFKRDRYVCVKQNKHGKKACPENFRPIEAKLKEVLLNDLNAIYFGNVSNSFLEQLVETKLDTDSEERSKEISKLQSDLLQLRNRKQRALEMLLDDKIDQEAYDSLLESINPKIDSLLVEMKKFEQFAVEVSATSEELKSYLLKQLNPEKPLSELTPSILARFVHKIIVKADGQLEVHYRTSKPSAFYVSENIQLPIPKNRRKKTIA